MLLEDTLLALGVFALTLISIGFVKLQRRKTVQGKQIRDRERGEHNAEALDAAVEMVCSTCGKPTSPTVDIYTHGAWLHSACYRAALGADES